MKLFNTKILEGLKAKAGIRRRTDEIRTLKNGGDISNGNISFRGFTDPAERKILESGGTVDDVEALRAQKAEAAAPDILKRLQAGESVEMTALQKDAVLRLSLKSPASAKPAPQPAATPPKAAAPAPRPAASVPTPAAAKPGPHAAKTITALAAMLKPGNSDATKAAARDEISRRQGFFTIESSCFVCQWRYHVGTAAERAEWSAAGIRISARNPSAAEKGGTVAAFLQSVGDDEVTVKFTGNPHEYKFPEASTKGRTAAEFLSLGRGDIRAIAAECGTHRGIALRRELYDATRMSSWYGKEQERALVQALRGAYAAAFALINSLGPHEADDETPPELSGQTSADQLLALTDDAAAGLNDQCCRGGGRTIRREIKRAYMKATSAQKAVMAVRFKIALQRHVHEFI